MEFLSLDLSDWLREDSLAITCSCLLLQPSPAP